MIFKIINIDRGIAICKKEYIPLGFMFNYVVLYFSQIRHDTKSSLMMFQRADIILKTDQFETTNSGNFALRILETILNSLCYLAKCKKFSKARSNLNSKITIHRPQKRTPFALVRSKVWETVIQFILVKHSSGGVA